MIRTGRTLAFFLLAIFTVNAARAGDPPDPYAHIRSKERLLLHLIDDAASRSSTFRHLIDRLSLSNVVVYVEYDAALLRDIAGRLSFVSAAGGVRYVRVGISRQYAGWALQAILGHELQHAVEIAEAPEVVDVPSLVALYERIGFGDQRLGRRWFESAAAQAIARRVQRELTIGPVATSGSR